MFTKLIQYFLRLLSVGAALALAGVLLGPQAAIAAQAVLVKNRLTDEKTNTNATAPFAPHPLTEDIYLAKVSPVHTTATPAFAHTAIAELRTPVSRTTLNTPTPAVTPTATPTSDSPSPTPTATHTSAPTPTETPTTTSSPVHTVLRSAKVAAVLAFARAQLGEDYVLGGAGPNVWDCSGLTLVAFASIGINIGTHSATNQYYTAADRGYLESYDDREAGDLIFYTDGGGDMYHVAIYSGGGMMIEAPDYGKPVREVPVRDEDRMSQVARFIR